MEQIAINDENISQLEESNVIHNFNEIGPLIIQGKDNANVENPNNLGVFPGSGDTSNENLPFLKVLDSGEVVLVSPEKGQNSENDKLTTLTGGGSSEAIAKDVDVGIGSANIPSAEVTEADTSYIQPVTIGRRKIQRSKQQVYYWSQEKIDDLLDCIRKHSRKFRKGRTTKIKIWNDISKDMIRLGHTSHSNKDECAKKWWNMYRSWKLIQTRPPNTNSNYREMPVWYSRVSQLSKMILPKKCEENGNLKGSSRRRRRENSKDLFKNMMEQSQSQFEAIEKAEEEFQMKAKVLDDERDVILSEIKSMLNEKIKALKAQANVTVPVGIMNSLNRLSFITVNDPTKIGSGHEQMFYIEIPEGSSLVQLLHTSVIE